MCQNDAPSPGAPAGPQRIPLSTRVPAVLARLRAAWQVLWGQRLVPFQIEAEWRSYQQVFQAQLEQFGAYLARAAKAEQKRLRRLAEQAGDAVDRPPPPATDRGSRKRELWRRLRTGGVPADNHAQKEIEV